MTQKRSYIIPEVDVVICCTSECMINNTTSDAPNPAPKRRTAEVF